MTKEQDQDSIVKTIEQQEGKLHVLINNSGTNWAEDITTYPSKAFQKLFAVNVQVLIIHLLVHSVNPSS